MKQDQHPSMNNTQLMRYGYVRTIDIFFSVFLETVNFEWKVFLKILQQGLRNRGWLAPK